MPYSSVKNITPKYIMKSLSFSHNPHGLLGIHDHDKEHKIIRVFRPGAPFLYMEVHGKMVSANKVSDEGYFDYVVSKETTYKDYKIYHQNGLLAHDPYSFLPTFGEVDQHLFGRGVHYSIHRQMGGRLTTHQGIKGVKFTVWAPSAQAVSLIGDFNYWDGRVNPMRSLGGCGVWELFVPGLEVGEKYKFEIHTQSGELRIKSDPYALSSELRPQTASIIADIDSFKWTDSDWIEKRKKQSLNRPIAIYEVHLGSWKKKNGYFLSYKELAHNLASYCNEMGFTHVELLPVAEHPFDASWGYQVTGFFAATSRFGTPQDFQYFVNYLHEHSIGVIIDWVPGHFPKDDFALARFDGTHLYEHHDPRQGLHPHWDTYIFNFGRKEVSNFLIASALLWLDVYHVDGLRVDAVASMLYLDYGRDHGEWIPNCFGGKENLDAIEFLKHANSIAHSTHPGTLMIAEESTSFRGVSHCVTSDGLGFDFKWNMGWMNDTLRYISKDPIYRKYHHNDLTFGLLYAFSEKFVLVFSHDEVVHGKQNLLGKMPGDYWQKFANLRLLYTYMICQPGKKLLFMGCEIGQWNEWHSGGEIEWGLLKFPQHDGIKTMISELNHLYQKEPCLWENDFSYHGFEWVDFHDYQNCVISFKRKSKNDGDLFCIFNFTPQYHEDYHVNLNNVSSLKEIFNSDDLKYGGSHKTAVFNRILYNHHGHPYGVSLRLAPLAGMIFRINY